MRYRGRWARFEDRAQRSSAQARTAPRPGAAASSTSFATRSSGWRPSSQMGEAQRAICRAAHAFTFDPRALEKAEERLFALRALARKHHVQVDDAAEPCWPASKPIAVPSTTAAAALRRLRPRSDARRSAYATPPAAELSAPAAAAARSIDKAVTPELPPLELERARFETAIESDRSSPGHMASTGSNSWCRCQPGHAAWSPDAKWPRAASLHASCWR